MKSSCFTPSFWTTLHGYFMSGIRYSTDRLCVCRGSAVSQSQEWPGLYTLHRRLIHKFRYYRAGNAYYELHHNSLRYLSERDRALLRRVCLCNTKEATRTVCTAAERTRRNTSWNMDPPADRHRDFSRCVVHQIVTGLSAQVLSTALRDDSQGARRSRVACRGL